MGELRLGRIVTRTKGRGTKRQGTTKKGPMQSKEDYQQKEEGLQKAGTPGTPN
jgi:hypothetical protein